MSLSAQSTISLNNTLCLHNLARLSNCCTIPMGIPGERGNVGLCLMVIVIRHLACYLARCSRRTF